MSYQYKLTPALKELANEAQKNDGQLMRNQVLRIVTNDSSSFYKLSRLGFSIKKSPIGKTGKNYVVEITPPIGVKLPDIKRMSLLEMFENWFFAQDIIIKTGVLSFIFFGFLMLAKFVSVVL